MKPNHASTVLGPQARRRGEWPQSRRPGAQEAGAAPGAVVGAWRSSDPHVAEYMERLRKEWIRAEGDEVAEQLDAAFGTFRPVGWSRPSNLGQVIDELTRTGRAARRLEYDVVDTAAAIDAIQSTHPAVMRLDHPAKQAVVDRAESSLAGCAAFAALYAGRSNDPVTAWSIDRYGRPDATTLDVAWSILTSAAPEATDGEMVGSDGVATFFRARLGGLSGWQVVVRPIQAAVHINPSARTIVVREDVAVTGAELERLVVHEIGAHIVRSENARRSTSTLAHLSLGRAAVATEEGLAAWWEDQYGASSPQVMHRYAARAIAVDVALSGGASDVMDTLTPFIGSGEAAVVTMRVKRGMADPEAPGAFTKDHSYLSGLLAVKAFLAADPPALPVLMATKWGLDMAGTAEELIGAGLLEPGRMPWEVADGGFDRPAH
ncbi:DUF1704 domain-containing protein [Sinomonas sp. JGH33]|uniref:DUF1704 domain-containing protein n=1 Tax=Sinomonas terricola TaxID=3110330 RepID=A0ABU5TB73_9MICC|nr:tyrosine/phenylalanine carboxypeptidase domain-containing protein [Sinomonas sp. JGH33]MEA5456947.1 DUF1704 domain-containing protein [Sinomonas sp. JGH33]